MIEQMDILDSVERFVGESAANLDAWNVLNDIHLPGKKSETYKFTPITTVLEKSIEWNRTGGNIFNTEKLYSTEGSHMVFINGVFSEHHSNVQNDLYYTLESVKEGKHDPFSLLNTALASNELTLLSGSEKPIFIYHFNDAGINSPRVRVKVRSGDTIQIVEKIIGGSNASFTNSYIHFEVDENAFAYHTKVQSYGTSILSHESVHAEVRDNGQFFNNTFSFESILTRNNLSIHLNGQNCEGYMYGLFLLDKKSHVDNNTTVDHTQPNSYSNELYKGILDEHSTGVFNGKIYVRQDAQKTNAFQANNNILMSENATLHTKPQLEIWADDVKCSHGCTSGQLDEDAIFYLRARGIDETTAKAMLLQAFAGETLAHVKIEEIKEEVLGLIDQKLH